MAGDIKQCNVPSIGHIVYVPPQPDWYFPMHEHTDTAEISFIVAGKGSFYSGSINYAVERGCLVVKNAKTIHAEKSDSEDPMDQICIEIRCPGENGLEENQLIPEKMPPVIMAKEAYDLFKGGFIFLRDYAHIKGFEETSAAVLMTILAYIREKVQTYRIQNPHSARASKQETMERIKEYVDQHYREKIRASDLAGKFYISEGHLSRQFKEFTGFNLSRYVIEKRMGEARRMLIFSDRDIKDIAIECGYHDLQYFYHAFRDSAGCTPLQYREKYAINQK